MHVTGNDFERGHRVRTDICIVGGGAAGLTIARNLIASGLDVVLLESGDVVASEATTDLGRGDNVGLPYFDFSETHFRELGGATAHWDGWIRPLDAIDFEKRSWVPLSGWPFKRELLDGYYRRAQSDIDVKDFRYLPDDWTDQIPELYPQTVANDRRLTLAVWRKANPPTRFAAKFLPELDAADNITLITRANVTNIVLNAAKSDVDHLEVRTLEGTNFTVAAQVMVLAAGGLETPRIMLEAGVGGPNVGRYWMEHPHVPSGRLILDRDSGRRVGSSAIDHGLLGALKRLELERPKGGNKFAFTLTPEAQEELAVGNVSLHLRGISGEPPRVATRLAAGLREPIHTLRRMPKEGEYSMRNQFRGFLGEIPDVLRVGTERLLKRPDALEIFAQAEQVPNRDSCITLSDQTDELGMPRMVLNWSLTDFDKHSIRTTLDVLDDAVKVAGIGEVVPYPEFEDRNNVKWSDRLTGGHHHLGATRMGTDPSVSVVDGDCRVHGLANMYVCGPSTFPTGGFANPLLTTVAMATRLADHLKLRRP
ncbi:MAG: GMC family oxidoreductase [Acidimicrobiales bacterium]